jgi:uncharacterized OB-fold protein
MALTPPPTIESFYKFCTHGKLMGLKCNRCKRVTAPPRSLCSHCSSSDVTWTELSGKGRLVTYTVIHIAPAQFQAFVPYAVGVVELADGVRLPGMIRNANVDNLRLGMELVADFDTAVPTEWPQWPRYFFREP